MNSFYSGDKILVLIPEYDDKSKSLSYVKLQTQDGNVATIYYNQCEKYGACIIDLSKIPLFYKERLITKIISDIKYKGKITIFDLKNPGNLW